MTNSFSTHESFYHGLVTSKIWLCEQLELAMDKQQVINPQLHVLGCWDNLLSFMLFVRRPNYYSEGYGYDIDELAITNANKLCDAWVNREPKITNQIMNVNDIDFSRLPKNSVIVNCSVDQIESNQWYDNIPKGQIVCLQATDVCDIEFPWLVKQFTHNLSHFIEKFPMSEILYHGIKEIRYGSFGYDRFMLIGIK